MQKGDGNIDCSMFVLEDTERIMADPLIAPVDGVIDLTSLYSSTDVVGVKRRKCAAVIEEMAGRRLEDLFPDQEMLYRQAQMSVPVNVEAAMSTCASSSGSNAKCSEQRDQKEAKAVSKMSKETIEEIHRSSLEKSEEINELKKNGESRSRNRKFLIFCTAVPNAGGHQCNYHTSDEDLMAKHMKHHAEENCKRGFKKCAMNCSLSVSANRAPQHLEKCHGVVCCSMKEIALLEFADIRCRYDHGR